MSFADIQDTPSEYRSTEYVKISSGVPLRLRVLDKRAIHLVKHFIPSQKVSIICLGDETCPICQNNQRLSKESPKLTPRQIRGYISRQNRYMVNVLNRTMVKETLSGNVTYAVSGQFPTHDANTGESLLEVEAKPLNRVQVLERGPTLFSQLNAIHDAVLDETGNPLGLTVYDITIMASGSGRKMATNVIPHPDQNDVVEIPDEEKFALESLGIQLSPSEITDLIKGVSLRDIFESRRASEEISILKDAEGQVGEGVQKSIDALFPEG